MADTTLAKKMEVLAKRAVEHSSKNYKIHLDFSEESIQKVESILTDIETTLPKGLIGRMFKKGPSEKEIENLCNMYGGYIGEIFRRNFGGEWNYSSDFTPDEKIVCLDIGRNRIFPPNKVFKRLFQGKGDDVWFYYQVMKSQLQQSKKEYIGGKD